MFKSTILYILFIFLMGSISLKAQKEAFNWFFGNNNGITWNTTRDFNATLLYGGTYGSTVQLSGLPTNISGTIPIATEEGCFSLSNSQGELQFFSDGTSIWNRNMTKMNTTNMTGNSSSAQSGIIMPYPGNRSKYIAISQNQWSFNQMAYTVVDMTLNSGLGGIESNNTAFSGHQGLLGESVSTVLNEDGTGYWVAAPGKGTNTYLNAWKVTPENGVISSTPVSTQIPGLSTGTSNTNGYFKFSPDRRHFVWATWGGNSLIFGDFDPEYGTFSNFRIITGTGAPTFYGVEFSLSGDYLYVTECPQSGATNYLYVFDFASLLAQTSGTVQNYFQSSTEVKRIPINSTDAMMYGVQLGPDGRIYISGNEISVFGIPSAFLIIENPEDINNLKVYKLNSFLNGTPKMGLPSFSSAWFEADLQGQTEFCAGSTQIEFTLAILRGVGSENLAYTRWDFGDGSTVVTNNNVDNGTIQTYFHAYNTVGNFTLTVTFHASDNSEITSMRRTLQIRAGSCSMPVNPHIRINLN